MKTFYLLAAFLICSIAPLTAQHNIGVFDSQTDVGKVEHKGFAWYDADNQTYLIGGSGSNMWFDSDAFHYLWTTLQGDFILRAEIAFEGEGVDPHRKAGWIVRPNLDANAPHVNATVHGDGLTSLQYRTAVGEETMEITSADSFPDVIQLERRGNRWIMSTARFGEPFTSVTLDSMDLGREVFAGLYVCAHNPKIVESAYFRNVRIVRPAGKDLQPYRDFLGSRLEIMDVATGMRKVIFTSAYSIQAPNWTPDGRTLIFNCNGRLYRYDLYNNEVSPLNTGFAVHCNNDHVLTFDGSLLGISNQDMTDGNSALYYLPTTGDSMPVRVTKPGVGASYLHGWSPDNRLMAFVGNRNNQYDIYTVGIHTGKVTRLTDQPTLDDGPEYSPDGKYIYFNSARTGTMQVWRMVSDGKHKQQLTFDTWNDWFPHVSPDQKQIVFISFPKEVDAQDHPFYKRCMLRAIPYDGGKPRVLGYIYGGQGTINVPSWSPDSKKIAFVTNTKM